MNLGVRLSGIELRNPFLLASGVLGETGESMLRVWNAGAGGVVTKSIGLSPREGYPNPVIVVLPHGLLNAMGLPGPGIEEFAEEVRTAVEGGAVVIGSVFGAGPDEFARLARRMEEYGVSAVELNLSCPHARGYGMEVGIDPEMVREIVEAVKSAVGIPVWAKLTPNVADIRPIVEAASGADAIVLMNTLRAMAIDIRARRPVLSNVFGGYSGPAVKPVGVRLVYEAYEVTDKPIIGVGGVTTGEDVAEYLMAGASAVQVGSAVYYRGVEVFRLLAIELSHIMEEEGFSTVQEMVGLAHG
jgi:dihydroorotate dehydrogenase (NAD+) catalytic subunit